MSKEIVRIALAQINTVVGDLEGNAKKIISFAKQAQEKDADIVSFPELTVTGYPPEDLLFKKQFIADNLAVLKKIALSIGDIAAVVGFAGKDKRGLYNAAALMHKGKIRGVYYKTHLPNYGVFDEKRYFVPGRSFPVFGIGKILFGVNICEDIWHEDGPLKAQAFKGAKLIININASPYHVGKGLIREKILRNQAKKHGVHISYVNLVGGQDELVFDGSSLVIDNSGKVLARCGSFKEELSFCDVPIPISSKKPKGVLKNRLKEKSSLIEPVLTQPKPEIEEIYDALALGLKDYIKKNGFKKVVLGLSGGIDSSLVASLAADAIGPENVLGVFMPSVFSSKESKEDAEALASNLGCAYKTISIQEIFDKYLEIIKPSFEGIAPNVAEENLQARIRGNIIMALSNKFGYLALNTGNKSEVSCGYCTLYGDMAGGFGVLKDVPKMLVYKLCEHKNSKECKEVIPKRVFEKAPTAELRFNQKDSDTLPEYEILDRILKLYVEEDLSPARIIEKGIKEELVRRVVHMVDLNEYKRRQAAPGIKITPKAFGRDRRMPITNNYSSSLK
ncbi:MAG TPA: NAD+ synthase [Candidatus Omnitrophota bacterium]|nr:NAD+ synthase [Candidatus Omnitrophota bacterium]